MPDSPKRPARLWFYHCNVYLLCRPPSPTTRNTSRLVKMFCFCSSLSNVSALAPIPRHAYVDITVDMHIYTCSSSTLFWNSAPGPVATSRI